MEKATYLEYYRNYYRNGGTADGGSTSNSNETSQTNMEGDSAEKGAQKDLGSITVNGVEYKRYRKLLFTIMYRAADL